MLTIRFATTDDAQLIHELALKVWPQTYADIISSEQIEFMMEMMYNETSLQKQMEEGCCFIISYDEEVPVGFAAYQEIEPTVYKLHKLYVLTSQQGKGTGRFLIDFITRKIEQQGATAVQLQVNRNNKAITFYEKLGFKKIQEADFDIGKGFFMNDYVMEKRFG